MQYRKRAQSSITLLPTVNAGYMQVGADPSACAYGSAAPAKRRLRHGLRGGRDGDTRRLAR